MYVYIYTYTFAIKLILENRFRIFKKSSNTYRERHTRKHPLSNAHTNTHMELGWQSKMCARMYICTHFGCVLECAKV